MKKQTGAYVCQTQLSHNHGLSQGGKMKMLDLISSNFYNAFYRKKERLGEDACFVKGLTIEEAYEVQTLVAERRIELGEHIVGFKVGCTSKAIRSQFGFDEPIAAYLFEPHVLDQNVEVDWSEYANCAIEPEMVLKLGKDVKIENPSDEDLIDAIDYVSPGIEIHNFKFWITPATIQELICSGGIHAGLVIGKEKANPRHLKFAHEMFHVFKDEELVANAPAFEIMGGPLHSLRWLVGFLNSRGMYLKKGALVIPGSPVELVSIQKDCKLKVFIESVGYATTVFQKSKKSASGD